jgi:hypothetical protein
MENYQLEFSSSNNYHFRYSNSRPVECLTKLFPQRDMYTNQCEKHMGDEMSKPAAAIYRPVILP